MKVYKFGGASIADAIRLHSLLPIIKEQGQPLIIVVSAKGKTTNALEKIVINAFNNNTLESYYLTDSLINEHLAYSKQVLKGIYFESICIFLTTILHELKNCINNINILNYDYNYDQIVCLGEIMSSKILSTYLHQEEILNAWVDARTFIKTDETYRDAIVDWEVSQKNAISKIEKEHQHSNIVITQGFIGSTATGKSTTLGREGSDYTAALLGAMLQAESVTIWKDVDGFRNADPKQYQGTVKIDEISYLEVIEMAYYGAQIIHPKTIKPLQNNNIPLYVKCFFDINLTGTIIKNDVSNDAYPPLIVLKQHQVLIQATTRDFSFITENNLSYLYGIFSDLKIKVNIIQNAALSFVACIDNRAEKVRLLIEKLNMDYKVLTNHEVELLTIRYYTPEIVQQLTTEKLVLLKQETRKTIQIVMK